MGLIRTSNLGIGIEGKEGLQAALASDFSVTQFKNIVPLMFWHGRLSYIRTTILSNFVFHRGFIISVIMAYFIMIFYYSTISIYNGYLVFCYSTVFTQLPVFSLILTYDINREQIYHYPELYKTV